MTDNQNSSVISDATHLARNDAPLDVTIAQGKGVWVTDSEGKRYLDLLSATLTFGHRHPDLVAVATAQLGRVAVTGGAVGNDQVGPFADALAVLTGKDLVLPLSTAAEAIDAAAQAARVWAQRVKGVPSDAAEIIVSGGGLSHGGVSVAFGDAAAIEAAITPNTAAVLVEPIHGETGPVIPPAGFLAQVRAVCDHHSVLLIANETRCGLGRVGTTFACEREGVTPDVFVLGAALGGGIMPLAAVAANADVLGDIEPGQLSAAFGGNPLASAVGAKVIGLLSTGAVMSRAALLGDHFEQKLGALIGHGVTAVRTAGLWAGVDIDASSGTAREIAERLVARGVLVDAVRGQTIVIAPPLVIRATEIDWAVEQLKLVLEG